MTREESWKGELAPEGASAAVNSANATLDEVLSQIEIDTEVSISTAVDDLADEVESLIVEKIIEYVRGEIKMLGKDKGIKVEELDAEASSNTYASGMNFRWTRNDVPVCLVEIDKKYEVWLSYISGYNATVDPDAPYRLTSFELYYGEYCEEGEEDE